MYRILIADDELIEKTVLCKTLVKHFKEQCNIYQAANGREALQMFDDYDIQIAILDIEMPGIDGIAAAFEMRRRKPKCVIIFLTAYDDFAYAKKAITIRALDYLLKPYQEDELVSIVEEAIRLTDKAEGYEKREGVSEEAEFDFDENEGRELEQDRLSKVMHAIQSYIEDNYIYDISMQDAAKAMNYSDAYFCKLFKQCFDKNFTAYLTEFRITEAKKLLRQPTVNVKKVGEAVGYMDSNYFAKVFRRNTGVTPTEYRLKMY